MIDHHKEEKLRNFKAISRFFDLFLKIWCVVGAGIGLFGYLNYGFEKEGHFYIALFFFMNGGGAILALFLTIYERRLFQKSLGDIGGL